MNKWITSISVSAIFVLAGIANFTSHQQHFPTRAHIRARYTKAVKTKGQDNDKISPGFIILGMHRSGTSLLTGLLELGYGYKVGDNLLEAQEDNPRGFFERIDVMDQNEHWLRAQGLRWNSEDLMNFDVQRALSDQDPVAVIKEMDLDITEERNTSYELETEGIRTLEFLTNEKNTPWLLKEPRLCITLPIWIDQLKRAYELNHDDSLKAPAVVLTYRHPIEVAESLLHRSEIPIERGFLLWLIYNEKAIKNSADLCRVYTSNHDIKKDPAKELSRISNELTENCGVPPPPTKLNNTALDVFFDGDLQHTHLVSESEDDCVQIEFEKSEEKHRREGYFREVIQVYCDIKRGRAFEADYQFPPLRYFYE